MEEISKQERQRTYNITLRRVRATIIAVESCMQCACAILQSVVRTALQYLSALLLIGHKMCLIFSTSFV
jgi:hypothetical protein